MRWRTRRSRVAKQHGARLLFLRFHRDEAHGRPARRLADRLRVGRVVLLAFDERLDVGRRNQADLVPEVADRAAPMMRAPAGLHRDDAARLLGQESQNLLARKLFSERHAAVSARAVRLKNPLCKVEPDDASFVMDVLSSVGCLNIATLAHCDAVGRGHPLHHFWIDCAKTSAGRNGPP